MNIDDNFFIKEAFNEAIKAYLKDEIPVGAIIVDQNKNIISRGFNLTKKNKFRLDHAEIIAIKNANSFFENGLYKNSILYVTSEPCLMCLFSAMTCGISKIVYCLSCKEWGSVNFLENFNENSNFKRRIPLIIKNNKYEEEILALMKSYFNKKRI